MNLINKTIWFKMLAACVSMVVLFSCSMTDKLKRSKLTVGVSQPNQSNIKDTVSAILPKFITFTDKDGNERIVTEAVLDTVTGEHITTIDLEGITVVAKSKNVPERNGKIDVEFIVTVPELLINKRWALTLTPELIKGDTILKLNDLVLSGKKFKKQQLKDYQKYKEFLESIIPDTADFKENFVDMGGVKKFIDRKSIEQKKQQDKELKRELSRISFAKSTARQQQMLRQRENIIQQAKAYEKRNRSNTTDEVRDRYKKNRWSETGTPQMENQYFSQLEVSREKQTEPKQEIENVTSYVLNMQVTEPEVNKTVDKTNVIFKDWNSVGTDSSAYQQGKAVFSSTDSLKIIEQFILKDKLADNEKRKMHKEQKYKEIVRHPYNDDARIDSIVNAEGVFRYFYSQPVPADEHTKKMQLTLTGKVEAMDNSTFHLPMTDTITYYVSSMVQFLDRTPRFRRKIIERRAEANMTAYINFPQGKDLVDEQLGANAEEINKVYDMIKKLTWSSEFVIDSITMTASSSPEGSWVMNEKLAKKRAQALKRFFAVKLDDQKGVDTLLNVKWIAEDWTKLAGIVVDDNRIENRDGILEIIRQSYAPDVKEASIRNRYKKDYAYLKEEIYPKLRVVDFKFNLHRAGMVKDTIHTTEPDTDYAEAMKMLEDRKYRQALSVLADYNDFNTAICYMSLGYDEIAYKILKHEPESSDTEYLLAILASRLDKQQEAVRSYLRSVELDESKAWRGLLDPEINKLIKAYNLNKEEQL